MRIRIISLPCVGMFTIFGHLKKTMHSPRCLFLAGFDQLMLGYEKKESLYLAPENLRAIFNLAGIVMPPVMLDGRVVGKWKRRTAS